VNNFNRAVSLITLILCNTSQLYNMSIFDAVRSGNYKNVELAIELVQESDRKALVNQVDYFGMTPLHWAAANGYNEIVKVLLSNGSYIDHQDHTGCTPLDWAAIDNRLRVVQILVAAGANINRQNNDGWAPLDSAVDKGNLLVIQSLIGAGAKINKETKEGKTPLCLAVEKKDLKVVQALIMAGAKINRRSAGATPLRIAYRSGHCQIVNCMTKYMAIVMLLAESTHHRLGCQSPMSILPQHLIQDIAMHATLTDSFYDSTEQKINNSWCIIS
jgi:ankyrin repeat protein